MDTPPIRTLERFTSPVVYWPVSEIHYKKLAGFLPRWAALVMRTLKADTHMCRHSALLPSLETLRNHSHHPLFS